MKISLWKAALAGVTATVSVTVFGCILDSKLAKTEEKLQNVSSSLDDYKKALADAYADGNGGLIACQTETGESFYFRGANSINDDQTELNDGLAQGKCRGLLRGTKAVYNSFKL